MLAALGEHCELTALNDCDSRGKGDVEITQRDLLSEKRPPAESRQGKPVRRHCCNLRSKAFGSGIPKDCRLKGWLQRRNLRDRGERGSLDESVVQRRARARRSRDR